MVNTMALRSAALFLMAISCLSLPTATLSQFIDPIIDKDYSCPPGFIPLAYNGANFVPSCAVDRCYGNPGPCGEGNPCTYKLQSISGINLLEAVCTCSAPSILSHIVYSDFCYVPGTDRCNPNPCKNGGTCAAVIDFDGGRGAYQCTCPSNFQGTTCELPDPAPRPTRRNGTAPPTPPPTAPPTPPPTPIIATGQGVCGLPGDTAIFPQRCWFNNDPRGRYVCCDNQGCDGFNDDNFTPRCKNYGYVPKDLLIVDPLPPPTGDQGLCGKPGDASAYPNRCWFNNDPLGRYVCCDNQGCDGFNADNQTPHCKNYGYVPPNFGRPGPGPEPTGPPTGGNQGVCGSGAASPFPIRCWYNNDPQGRYVCCDNDGCGGFYPPDNLFPRCKSNGFVPPNL